MASEILLTDPSYWNGRGPHGGWIAARLLDAAGKLAGPRMVPRTLMVDFMDRIQPGAFVIDVQALARHPHVTFWHVTLQQDGRTCVHATAVFAAERHDGEHAFEPAPAIGAPRAHPQVGELASLAAFPGQFDYRIAGGWPGTPGARALTQGFVRPKDERRITPALLAMLADAWFPALWAVGARVPAATVSMALVFTSNDMAYLLGADDYLQARFCTSALAGDFGDESASLWWPDGRLAVKAQQLLRYSSSTHALVARSRPTEPA